jgi:acyl carrier protein
LTTPEAATRIRAYIIENFLFGDESMRLDGDESLLELGVVDSTGVLDLLNFVEEEFGIAVADEELAPDNFDSINKLAAFVVRKTTPARWPSQSA